MGILQQDGENEETSKDPLDELFPEDEEANQPKSRTFLSSISINDIFEVLLSFVIEQESESFWNYEFSWCVQHHSKRAVWQWQQPSRDVRCLTASEPSITW